jgi:hypothetical protein
MAEPLLYASMAGEADARSELLRFIATERLVAWADAIGPKINKALKDEAPVGEGPGAGVLKESIQYQRTTISGMVTLRFHTNVPYARYVVEGTGQHPISARNAQTLHFTGRDGVEYFRHSVNHPGNKPNPFNQRAYERMLPEIAASFRAVFEGM